MYSVTLRIKTVTQPRNGYVKSRDLAVTEYMDSKTTYEVNAKYKAIQGMAVDYLTRMRCGASREEAFRIPLLGAKRLSQSKQALKLLNAIKGLDKRSIINACKLTSYDVAYRASAEKFVPVSSIMPSNEVIHNIQVYTQRSVRFFEKNGPITDMGLTFQGGYNLVVSTGDCDFLSEDTLWDLKVSRQKPTSENTLQLLMYYILGLHSIHGQFQKLRRLGIFNPVLNCAYTIDVDRIPDTVFHAVSRDVLGYHTPDNPAEWKMAFGTDPVVLADSLRYVPGGFSDTGFRPEKYPDGTYDISVADYWSYWQTICGEDKLRPKFPYTKYVKFLKRDGFYMFLSVSKNDGLSLLYGGARRKLDKPISYYQERMGAYGHAVLDRFSKYWFALYSISEAVRRIRPNPQIVRERLYEAYVQRLTGYGLQVLNFEDWYRMKEDTLNLTGRVHGCIVDLDFCNHIYLNPYDGSIAAYHALSTDEKYVFRNVASLLAEERPEMLTGYRALLANGSPGLVPAVSAQGLATITEEEIRADRILVEDTSMYDISNRLKVLQMIYDHRVIGAWYDQFLALPGLSDKTKEVMLDA